MVDSYQPSADLPTRTLTLPARPGPWHFDWAHKVDGGNKAVNAPAVTFSWGIFIPVIILSVGWDAYLSGNAVLEVNAD